VRVRALSSNASEYGDELIFEARRD
jgi:hypothetical protein